MSDKMICNVHRDLFFLQEILFMVFHSYHHKYNLEHTYIYGLLMYHYDTNKL